MTTFIVLLRAVNVGGRKVEMARLRVVAEKAGFRNVRSYIASGNLVLEGDGAPATVQAKLEKAIAAAFGIAVPVIVRTADEWKAYLRVPKAFDAIVEAKPNWVLVGLSQSPPPPAAEVVAALTPRATLREGIEMRGDALWIYYAGGVAGTKVTPAAIDKAMGSPTTSRNVNTVRKLAEMAGVLP